MKLSEVEHYVELAEQDAQAQALSEISAYRPKFRSAVSWSRIEEVRDPHYVESPEYRISRLPTDKWLVTRGVWHGYPEQPMCALPDMDSAKRFVTWALANTRLLDDALYNDSHTPQATGFLDLCLAGRALALKESIA